jgi:hypothetical protein
LNQHLYKEKLINIISNVNQIACAEPVDNSQVIRVVNSIWKYKEEGILELIYNHKTRKIVFAAGSKLNREEKLSICRAEIIIKRGDDSRQKLYNIIEGWDFELFGKITLRRVTKNHPISYKTVAKYWGEFKDYVKELNDDHK